MLSIDRLSLAFRTYEGLARQRETVCLADISLTLSRGEMLAVIGASGSGKSLLAHSILGLVPPNAVIGGSVALDGTPLASGERLALCGTRLALVPQSITHLDPLVRTGRQLGWAARRAGRDPAGIPAFVAATLGREGIDGRAFPHELSGGMARRTLLAMATAGNAEAILADEPTSGLDADNAMAALTRLRALADAGRAVMLITHDLAAALPLADRVAILRDGRLVSIEPARAFTGSGEELDSAYARALWRALPQNGFGQAGGVDALGA